MLARLLQRPEPIPVTVDHQARQRMALLVRRLAARRIDNFTFEDAAEDPACAAAADPGLSEAFEFCWSFYDDFHRHRLPKLDPETRRLFARVVLFLHSDRPYCWIEDQPRRRGIVKGAWVRMIADFCAWTIIGLKVPIFALGSLAVRVAARFLPRYAAPYEPDWDARECAWPFASTQELAESLATPRYLAGSPRSTAA